MSMKALVRSARVKPGDAVDLKSWQTRVELPYDGKRDYKDLLESNVSRLSELQELLYATSRHAVLVIFQAMDAAGKDGCIKHVMSGINPQGCDVYSYSHPSAVELRHDFLWRTTRDLPESGKIVIFNRSYYEEVLIVRVHPEILHAEALPDDGDDARIWKERYQSIVGLERHLVRNGTRIVKIFLHVSKEEQRRRLLDRIDTPAKTWKIKQSDIDERRLWNKYRKAYEDCLAATSTKEAPWHIVPADDKPTARLIVSSLIVEALERLDMSFPEPTKERVQELAQMRRRLEQE